MKRTAIILGIAAAMGIAPSVAAGGNITTQDRPQDKVQIFKPQPQSPARATVARVSAHRFTAHRISVLRIQSR